MTASSPQSATIAAALDTTRATQPFARFDSLGSILATPELSLASPWLNTTNQNVVISDEALEIIPSQLLPRLRADSIGSIVPAPGGFQIQFSGVDGYAYGVQVSADLSNWSILSTNYPDNGTFDFFEARSTNTNAHQTFYRTVVLP
jgi:hypothetical protein